MTLALFVLTVVAWFGLEFWFVLRGKPSISGRIWAVYHQWPPLGMLTGLVVGMLLAHFFFGQCGPG